MFKKTVKKCAQYRFPKEYKNVEMKTTIPGPKSQENLKKLGKILDTRSSKFLFLTKVFSL
jgi:hypothetical protein